MEHIQEFESTWPELKFAWSFILLFAGLLLNIVATVIFLTLLLIRGEIKASKATKGFEKVDTHVVTDTVPLVSTVSHSNEAYVYDISTNSQIEETETSAHEYEICDGQATPISDGILADDIHLQDESTFGFRESPKSDYTMGYENQEPYTDLNADRNDVPYTNISTVTESVRL